MNIMTYSAIHKRRSSRTTPLKGLILSLLLLASTAGAAEPLAPLSAVPVVDSKLVSPGVYREASLFAARGNAPLDVALKIAGKFEGATQHIIQVNEGSESPSASRITILRDGLLDDSVRGERWDIALERTAEDGWNIKEVRRSWRCWRGEQTNRFASKLCP
jgi:hypothetical protein